MRLETGVVDNAPRTSAVRWSSREFRIRVGILAGYVVLALLRVPQIALHGRFWAEEGTVYFSQALEKGCLAYLFTPALGYYSLVNKVACLLATVPPLEFAPLVTVYVSLVIQAVPVALVLFCGIPGLKGLGHQAVAVALLLVVQPNQEVWLNTINGQFHLCIATGLILVSRARSRRGHVARLVVLAVAGLTGVLSCLLLPLYIVEWLSDRRKRRAHEVVALSVACLVQLVAVVASPSREAGMFWRVLPVRAPDQTVDSARARMGPCRSCGWGDSGKRALSARRSGALGLVASCLCLGIRVAVRSQGLGATVLGGHCHCRRVFCRFSRGEVSHGYPWPHVRQYIGKILLRSERASGVVVASRLPFPRLVSCQARHRLLQGRALGFRWRAGLDSRHGCREHLPSS